MMSGWCDWIVQKFIGWYYPDKCLCDCGKKRQ